MVSRAIPRQPPSRKQNNFACGWCHCCLLADHMFSWQNENIRYRFNFSQPASWELICVLWNGTLVNTCCVLCCDLKDKAEAIYNFDHWRGKAWLLKVILFLAACVYHAGCFDQEAYQQHNKRSSKEFRCVGWSCLFHLLIYSRVHH